VLGEVPVLPSTAAFGLAWIAEHLVEVIAVSATAEVQWLF
jgi:hypothetical protein